MILEMKYLKCYVMLYLTMLYISWNANNNILNMNSLFSFCPLHTAQLQYQSSLGVSWSCHRVLTNWTGTSITCATPRSVHKNPSHEIFIFTFWMILWQILKMVVQQDEMIAEYWNHHLREAEPQMQQEHGFRGLCK